ncbi:hypothetical protein [Streptosporangium canum]|uniref:hypothetical protein n=1 Tax=Streptosporangium canum TaxID=324952 RepID=UPI0034205E91
MKGISVGSRVITTGTPKGVSGKTLTVAAAQWSLIVPLFTGLLLIGVGLAVSLQSRFAATDLAQPHHKARSLALVVWAGTLGSALGPNLGVPGEIIGAATGLTMYTGAFLIAAVCLAIAGLIVWVWLRPDPLLFLGQTTPASPAGPAGRQPGRIRQVLAELRGNQRAWRERRSAGPARCGRSTTCPGRPARRPPCSGIRSTSGPHWPADCTGHRPKPPPATPATSKATSSPASRSPAPSSQPIPRSEPVRDRRPGSGDHGDGSARGVRPACRTALPHVPHSCPKAGVLVTARTTIGCNRNV